MIRSTSVTLVLFVIGCGSNSATPRTGCVSSGIDLASGLASMQCTEFEGLSTDKVRAICTETNRTIVETGCPKNGLVGSCTTSFGGLTVTDFSYAPTTRDEAQSSCSTTQGTFHPANTGDGAN